jgi:hypothetical protein
MPEVTVWVKPNGLPMATTKSPTRSWSLSPSVIAVSFSPGCGSGRCRCPRPSR